MSSTTHLACCRHRPGITRSISLQAQLRLWSTRNAICSCSRMSSSGSAPTCSTRASFTRACRHSRRPRSSFSRMMTLGGFASTTMPSTLKQCATCTRSLSWTNSWMSSARWTFTKLDFCSSYHQVQMHLMTFIRRPSGLTMTTSSSWSCRLA